MRVLGDDYVKSEFRAHRNVENPAHIVSLPSIDLDGLVADLLLRLQIGFLTEWQMYAQKLEGDTWRGEKLDSGKIEKMSGMCPIDHVCSSESMALTAVTDQQLGQLYELMQTIQKGEGEGGDEQL